jgi:hypothetical protein
MSIMPAVSPAVGYLKCAFPNDDMPEQLLALVAASSYHFLLLLSFQTSLAACGYVETCAVEAAHCCQLS